VSSSAKTFRPHPDSPQERALASDANTVIFGGANGGGKTFALCYAPALMLRDPNFYGVIFRRTYPEIEHSIEKQTKKIYPHLGGKYNHQKHLWKFPSGAEIKLSHLQRSGDEDDWDSAELSFIGFDQLEKFEKRQFFFLASRLRNPECAWEPFMFATCNPAPQGHWLHRFVSPWLDDDDTYPVDELDGERRWYFSSRDGWRWADRDDREIAEVGDEEVEVGPKSVEFHSATVMDNPTLLEGDAGYVRELHSLSERDRLMKLRGAWGLSSDDSPLGHHQIQIKAKGEVPDTLKFVRYWDLADTEPHPGNKDPCHTAGVKAAVMKRQWTICGYNPDSDDDEGQGEANCGFWRAGSPEQEGFWLEGESDDDACPECGNKSLQTDTMPIMVVGGATWFQLSGSKKQNRMVTVARQDGQSVEIGVEQEPGATGKESAREYKRNVFPQGHRVRLDRPTGDKMTRLSTVVPLAETGRVWLIEGRWNIDYIEAIENLDPQDVIDATTGAYKLARKRMRRGGVGGSHFG